MNGWISGIVALALVIAISVAGCGGGEDTADAGVTLTKAEFIKQGDAICEEVVEQRFKQIEAYAKKNGFSLETASKQQLEELVTSVAVPSLKKQTEQFNALGVPEGDDGQVEKIVVAWESATKEAEDNPGLATEKDLFDEADAMAKSYGFKFCGLK